MSFTFPRFTRMCFSIKLVTILVNPGSFPVISPASIVREVMTGLEFTTSSRNANAYSATSSSPMV